MWHVTELQTTKCCRRHFTFWQEFNIQWLHMIWWSLRTCSSRLICVWCDPDRTMSQYKLTLTQWMFFQQMNRIFLCCGAVRSSTPSHPFTTPTTWSRPTAWVSPTWRKLNQMPATVRYTNLPVWVSLWVQMGHNICWLMKLQTLGSQTSRPQRQNQFAQLNSYYMQLINGPRSLFNSPLKTVRRDKHGGCHEMINNHHDSSIVCPPIRLISQLCA